MVTDNNTRIATAVTERIPVNAVSLNAGVPQHVLDAYNPSLAGNHYQFTHLINKPPAPPPPPVDHAAVMKRLGSDLPKYDSFARPVPPEPSYVTFMRDFGNDLPLYNPREAWAAAAPEVKKIPAPVPFEYTPPPEVERPRITTTVNMREGGLRPLVLEPATAKPAAEPVKTPASVASRVVSAAASIGAFDSANRAIEEGKPVVAAAQFTNAGVNAAAAVTQKLAGPAVILGAGAVGVANAAEVAGQYSRAENKDTIDSLNAANKVDAIAENYGQGVATTLAPVSAFSEAATNTISGGLTLGIVPDMQQGILDGVSNAIDNGNTNAMGMAVEVARGIANSTVPAKKLDELEQARQHDARNASPTAVSHEQKALDDSGASRMGVTPQDSEFKKQAATAVTSTGGAIYGTLASAAQAVAKPIHAAMDRAVGLDPSAPKTQQPAAEVPHPSIQHNNKMLAKIPAGDITERSDKLIEKPDIAEEVIASAAREMDKILASANNKAIDYGNKDSDRERGR